jgi:hypothetical protein
LPISPSHTILQYDIYTKKGLPEAEKAEFVEFLQEVEYEDFDLCVKTQQNLNQGVYSTGFLHPSKESGVLFYQNLTKDFVKAHYDLEKAAGHEINPAQIVNVNTTDETDELEDICANVECKGTNPETFAKELNW